MSTVDASRVVVSVDKERCVGSATCLIVAPDNFLLDEHDRSEPTETVTTEVTAVEQAEQLCPTGAIRISRVTDQGTP
jgi:ferredoxin